MRSVSANKSHKVSNHRYLKIAIIGYASYCIIGATLLSLPISQISGEAGLYVDGLFMASSAMSTTGLGTVTVSSYTWFGQFVLLALIQLGGLGYMTIGAFAFSSIKRINPRNRGFIQKSMSNSLHENPFAFLRKIVYYTVIVELIGAALLFPAMLPLTTGPIQAAWIAIFHSISAFCTAGFSTFDTNLLIFSTSNFVMTVFIILMLLGGIGFLVAFDVLAIIRKKRQTLTFTSKVIIAMFVLEIIGATAFIFISEAGLHSIIQVLFTVVSAISGAGFAVYDMGIMLPTVVIIFYLLMTFGAAPVSTGGGMKVTNVALAIVSLRAYLRGDEYASIRENRISKYETKKSISSVFTYLIVLLIAIMLLFLIQPNLGFSQGIFEVASALGTVGLSMGITGALIAPSKLLLSFTMFIGRIGPIVWFEYFVYFFKNRNYKEDEVF